MQMYKQYQYYNSGNTVTRSDLHCGRLHSQPQTSTGCVVLQPCDRGVEPPVSHVGTPVADGSSGARRVLVRRGWNQQAERGPAVSREVLVCPGQSTSLCDELARNPVTDNNVNSMVS